MNNFCEKSLFTFKAAQLHQLPRVEMNKNNFKRLQGKKTTKKTIKLIYQI